MDFTSENQVASLLGYNSIGIRNGLETEVTASDYLNATRKDTHVLKDDAAIESLISEI